MTALSKHTAGGDRLRRRYHSRHGASPAAELVSPLSAHALNIEEKSRCNLFPWRGQFSPQLVEALLRAYAPPNATILDPFMGSGTVLVESAGIGLPVYGCEINPAAYLLARLYEFCNLDSSERLELLDNAEAILMRMRPTAFVLPLLRSDVNLAKPQGNVLDWIGEASDFRIRMLLEALVVLADGDDATDATYASKWFGIRDIITGLPFTKTQISASLRDARSLLLPDGSIDFVLTSPPYINVFNYHHNSRAGIEALGWKPLVVARSEIGANRKFRQNRFLTVVQYCMDMALVLAELRRVCSDSGRLLLILGRESNVQKTPFYNGQILERIATEVVGLEIELRQERVFVNRFGKSIYEDILHLSLPFEKSRPGGVILLRARDVARQALSDALHRTPLERKPYLQDAIERIDQIDASPILVPTAAHGDVL